LDRFLKKYGTQRKNGPKHPNRIFINQFKAGSGVGMIEHEDVTVFCTVILSLTTDDSSDTALQLGRKGVNGPMAFVPGSLVAFRSLQHELPATTRNNKRLTINFFF
jgi:hypothetical protein